MYALTFLSEGTGTNLPYATTIAVSENKEKLYEELERCVQSDISINEDDEYDDTCNYEVHKKYTDEIVLFHRTLELYTRYTIRAVDVF
jgi:hypothetical protein